MEYDRDENTWRRPSSYDVQESKWQQIPKRSTVMAVSVLGLAVLSCLLGYSVLSESLPPNEPTDLLLVIIFFRHGARTPVKTYQSDPFKKTKWPDGFGSLTKDGKLQMYELGSKYRNHYVGFIKEEYYERNVYVRSSDKSRCIMSALAFLAGLYPPTEDQMWHPDLKWQPIPVRSLPTDLDDIVAATKPCKKWKEMYQEVLEELNSNKHYADLFDQLSKYTNQSVRSVLEIDFLYSTLQCEQDAELKLPEWTKTFFPNRMRTPFMQSLAAIAYNETLQRLKVGPFLSEIKQHLNEYIDGVNTERNLYLYSGHDVNLVSIWRAIGFSSLLEPGYGASMTLELHRQLPSASDTGDFLAEQKEQYFIKMYYHNNTNYRDDDIKDYLNELELPFCDSQPCSYSQFIQHIDKLIPSDWEGECGNRK